MDKETRPALGTAESAVLAFVNCMANATELREEQLAYWLDCYYQLRRHYDRELGAPDDLLILRHSDLEQVFRQLWQETLKKSCRQEAAKRLADRETARQDASQKNPEDNGGLSPAAAAAAAFKRKTRDRFLEAREAGLTLAETVKAGDGVYTENALLTILDGGRQPIEIYRALADALEKLAPAANTE